MQKSESLEESIIIVKTLGSIYKEENLRVDIDFDPNDGLTIVKYEDTESVKRDYIYKFK